MKKTRIYALAVSLCILVALLSAFAVTASAASETLNGFTVRVTDQIAYEDDESKNYGTSYSNFDTISMEVVDSKTVRFTYKVWLKYATGGASAKTAAETVTVTNYSCNADLDVSFNKSYEPKSSVRWTYKIKVTKAAGHIYDNACDASCNICGETRSVPHNYTNGVCTVCGTACTHASVNANGLCAECKFTFVASVTVGGEVRYYANATDLPSAVENATAKPYVKLLADIELTETLEFKKAPFGMELDLAGRQVYNPDNVAIMYGINWEKNNQSLVLRDTVGSGEVISGRFSALECESNAEILGGTFRASVNDDYTQSAAIDAYRSIVKIYDGNFEANDSAVMVNNAEVYIYGGSYVSTGGIFDARGNSVLQVYGAEFPNGIAKEKKHDSYAVPLNKILDTDYYLRDNDGNLINTEGNVYAVSGAVTVSKGADLSEAVITVDGDFAYNGSPIIPEVTVTVDGRIVDPANYDLAFSNNTNVGEATVTVTAKGDVYTGTNDTAFTIVKGNPTVTPPTPKDATELIWCGLKLNLLGDKGNTNGGTLEYNVNGGDWTTTNVLEKDAGEYTVGYRVVGDENWNDVAPQYITVNITKRDFENTDHRVYVILNETVFVYDGTEKKPEVQVQIFYKVGGSWLGRDAEAEDYTVAYSYNVNAGSATVTVTATGDNCVGSITEGFVIKSAPIDPSDITLDTDEFIYNGTEQKPSVSITVGGKTLVEGTDFRFNWPYNVTDAGEKTVTTSGNYSGTFTYEIKKADPVLTLTSPIPAVLSGNKVKLVPTISYGELTDGLPTEIAITSATNATWNGMIITVNDDLIIGQDTVSITVTSAATANYNSASYTLTLDVGMVDYTQYIDDLEDELNTAVETLEAAIEAQVDPSELAAAIKNVTDVIDALDSIYATDNDVTEKIAAAISTAKNELTVTINKVASDLETAKNDLTKAINENEADIEDKVAKLDDAYKAADVLINADIANLKSEDTAIKESITNLETTLKEADDALDAAIKKVASDLETTKNDLTKAINENEADIEDKVAKLDDAYKAADVLINADIANLKSEDTAIKESITNLETTLKEADDALDAAIKKVAGDLETTEQELLEAIEAGDTALGVRISALSSSLSSAKRALEKADAENKAALEAQIANSEAALKSAVKAVQDNLDAAKAELVIAIAEGDIALDVKITTLNESLAAAKAALEASDEENKNELTKKIDDGYASLDLAVKAVQKNLDDVKAELDAKDKALTTAIIVVGVVSGVSFLGSGAFVTWFFIDKRKKLAVKNDK